MPASSYQMEWLLHRLRRWMGYPVTGPQGAGDRLSVSGASRAKGHGLQPPPRRRGEAVRDAHLRPPPVEDELERRAGSFMRPPYPQPPLASKVPLLRPPRWEDAEAQTGEADASTPGAENAHAVEDAAAAAQSEGPDAPAQTPPGEDPPARQWQARLGNDRQ